MGYPYQVWGWAYAEHLTPGRPEWHYRELYSGSSLTKALWTALCNKRKYGCIKMEIR